MINGYCFRCYVLSVSLRAFGHWPLNMKKIGQNQGNKLSTGCPHKIWLTRFCFCHLTKGLYL